MVQQQDSLAAAHVGVRGGCGGSIGGEGQLHESSGRLYRARRGERGRWLRGIQGRGL
jgi:hypothetical protein